MDLKYIQIIILASVFALQFLLEHIWPQRRDINDRKNERFNIAVGLFNLALTFVPATLFVQLIQLINEKQFGLLNQFQFSFWVEVVVTLLVMDLWMYIWHRWNHQVPILWRLHSFHHTDTMMNSTTALRFNVLELFLSYPGKAIVSLVFGISYLPLLIYEILFFISVVVHHSNIYTTERIDKVYRILFASPLMHRIHHSTDWYETNSNFGALFSLWDRIFKSWKMEKNKQIKFGLPKKGM